MTLNGAIKQLHELRIAEDMPIYYKPIIAEVINVLLMDVQVVRHGEWQKHPTEREWDVCSCCGIGTKRREYGLNPDGSEWVTEYSYHYCPNCGAKMEIEDGHDR